MRRLATKFTLFAVDAAFALLIAITLAAGFATPALAYVDPSVMTYTIQALAGVAVALSALFGVMWRRAKRFFQRVFHIDENSGKVKEPEVVACSSESELAAADTQALAERAQQGIKRQMKLPWIARLLIAILATGTFAFTQLVSAPLEVIATNATAFQFSYAQIWQTLAIVAVIVAIVAAILISLLRGKAFEVVIAFIVGVTIAALVQALFLNNGLPQADGHEVDWTQYTTITVESIAMWVVVIVALIAVAILKPSFNRLIAVFACILIATATGVNLYGTLKDASTSMTQIKNAVSVTKDGLNTVSDKSNVIYLVLDTMDTTYLDEAVQKDPTLLNEFTGFTWFHNTTSVSVPTRNSVPFLVTGNFFDMTEERTINAVTETEKQFEDSGLLEDLNAQGYSVGVYSDTVNDGYLSEKAPLVEQTMNIHELETSTSYVTSDKASILKMMYEIAAYRDLPWIAKPNFRYYTDDINASVIKVDTEDNGSAPYIMNDLEYYSELSANGLKLETGTNGAYRFIHLSGSHQPWNVTTNLTRGDSNAVDQTIAAMKIAAKYLQELKKLGVYEQSNIIVCADHGIYDWENREIPAWPTTPAILVKEAGDDSTQPCVTNNAPVSQFDLPATIRKEIGVATSERSIFEYTESEYRERYYYANQEAESGDVAYHELKITGDANYEINWTVTGRVWPITRNN